MDWPTQKTAEKISLTYWKLKFLSLVHCISTDSVIGNVCKCTVQHKIYCIILQKNVA